MGRLGRDDIERALRRLGEVIAEEGLGPPCEVILAGGAALVLLYGARESTKDVDALVLPAEVAQRVRAVATGLAEELMLPEDWLNDAAKGYIHGLARGETLLEMPGLVVRALAPQQLLAMKLSAWRDDLDVEDSRLLLRRVPGGREEVWELVEPHLVPGRELKARYAFDDLWEETHESR